MLLALAAFLLALSLVFGVWVFDRAWESEKLWRRQQDYPAAGAAWSAALVGLVAALLVAWALVVLPALLLWAAK